MNPNTKTLTQIRRSLQRSSAIERSNAFKQFLIVQKQMQDEIDKTWELVRQNMEAHDIEKIDGEWGYIRISERHTYDSDGSLAPRFYKQVVDGSKVASYLKIAGKLPRGAQVRTTKYLSKRIKV